MTVYKFKSRNLSEKPTRIDLIDTNDDSFGTVDVLFRDPNSLVAQAKVKAAKDLLNERDRKRIDEPKSAGDYKFRNDWSIRFHVEHYVVDSAILDHSNKPIKHDVDMLTEFLSQDDMAFCWDAVLGASFDIANFRKLKEDETKNA